MNAGYAIGSKVWPGTAKTLEEMGELGQVLGKLIALGGPIEHWDGTKLDRRLTEEIADVYAALDFFVDMNGLDKGKIERRRAKKFKLFWSWHKEQKK